MGISGLLPLLKSIHKPCNLKQFAGKTLGVDAYGWLHRGTVACAIDLALGKPTTKHVHDSSCQLMGHCTNGCCRFVDFAMNRVRMLVHFGVTPYIVFDGDFLPSKAGTEKERASRREEGRKRGLELLNLGKTAQAQQELQKAVDVTPEMARMFIDELKRANIQYVVAPYEADSQMAYLERKGIIQGIVSEDSDLLVFGARCLITKLDQYGNCILIRRDDFTACREISLVGWSDVEFRRMAILSGCDYLPSMNKIGLKTAYRLLRKHKSIERLLRALQLEGQTKVPAGYLEDFQQAERTFMYQWVFCPVQKGLVNLTEPKSDVDISTMPYIGKFVEPLVAAGVACGDLNPHTKKPILVKSMGPPRQIIPRRREQLVTETPELKKTKSIDSFFKPRRTPLAELDPNCFTPSPSQQRLLDNAGGAWSATPAPLRRQRATPSTAPAVTRRAVSDSWSISPTVARSPKRQRLCSDVPLASLANSPVIAESSRFFSSSTRKSMGSRRSSKAEFNVWSDDSIEEALLDLPEILDNTVSQQSEVKDAKVEENTQSTVDSQQSTDLSQSVTGNLTPATSVDSQESADGTDLPTMKMSLLKERFTFSSSAIAKTSTSTSSTQDTQEAVESQSQTQSLLTSKTGKSLMEQFGAQSKSTSNKTSSSATFSSALSRGKTKTHADTASSDDEVIIPGSDFDIPEEDNETNDVDKTPRSKNNANFTALSNFDKGSEDLLIVSDSEGECSDEMKTKILGLRKFTFVAN